MNRLTATAPQRHATYLVSFLLTLHYALPIYVGSGFIAQFLPPAAVGWLYASSSLLSLGVLWFVPRLVERFRLPRLNLAVTILNAAALLLLVLGGQPTMLLIAFVVFQTAIFVLRFNLDLYLEEISDDANAGTIRGLFLTAGNVAWVISPTLAGWLVESSGFSAVYLLSLIILVPFFLISRWRLTETHGAPHHQRDLWQTARALWRATDGREYDLRRILVVDFSLNLFYAIMVIYTPLYLRSLEIPWPTVGLILSTMLLPFLLLQWPLGMLADRRWGEKELLTTGLAIAGITTVIIALVDTPTAIMIGGLLFLTRVGAATVEAMKETYLFKKIGPGDSAILALSRDTQPLAYLLAPAAASVLLTFLDLRLLFLPIGGLLLTIIFHSRRLHDTL